MPPVYLYIPVVFLLIDFQINFTNLVAILFQIPCIFVLATVISRFLGYSSDQFSLVNNFSIMKGSAVLGIAISMILAPIIEEIGWRGHSGESLRAFLIYLQHQYYVDFFAQCDICLHSEGYKLGTAIEVVKRMNLQSHIFSWSIFDSSILS